MTDKRKGPKKPNVKGGKQRRPVDVRMYFRKGRKVVGYRRAKAGDATAQKEGL